MKTKILEAIQKGIQKSFNFEVDSDEGDFKIKKAKLNSKIIDNWVYDQYQQKYEELIEKEDFQGCIDLYNSGKLGQKPKAIGYKVYDMELYELVYGIMDKSNSIDLNWIDVSEVKDMSELFLNVMVLIAIFQNGTFLMSLICIGCFVTAIILIAIYRNGMYLM